MDGKSKEEKIDIVKNALEEAMSDLISSWQVTDVAAGPRQGGSSLASREAPPLNSISNFARLLKIQNERDARARDQLIMQINDKINSLKNSDFMREAKSVQG